MHLRDFPFILRYFPNKEHKVKPIAQAAQTAPTVPIAQAAQTVPTVPIARPRLLERREVAVEHRRKDARTECDHDDDKKGVGAALPKALKEHTGQREEQP